jgi:hypothetical protein
MQNAKCKMQNAKGKGKRQKAKAKCKMQNAKERQCYALVWPFCILHFEF